MRLAPRWVFAAIFAVCAAMIGYALFLQEYQGLEPCPMCILQRYAFVAIAVVALVAAIHGPLVALFAIAGAGVAMRHSWLQHFPPAMETCGTDLEFLINTFPLSQAL